MWNRVSLTIGQVRLRTAGFLDGCKSMILLNRGFSWPSLRTTSRRAMLKLSMCWTRWAPAWLTPSGLMSHPTMVVLLILVSIAWECMVANPTLSHCRLLSLESAVLLLGASLFLLFYSFFFFWHACSIVCSFVICLSSVLGTTTIVFLLLDHDDLSGVQILNLVMIWNKLFVFSILL